MSETIQEEEMYITSQYCKKFINELTDALACETKKFDAEISNCRNKIQNEQNDIAHLRNQINLCTSLISSNKKRLSEIPNEINFYNNDIRQCESNIANTVVPVYRSEWDDYRDCFVSVYDYEQTSYNENYIRRMEEQISEDKRSIESLERLRARCEYNIKSLNEMIGDINKCIAEKQNLINKINQGISYLQSAFSNYKKVIINKQDDLNVLDRKILKGAELIHNFGCVLSNLSYKNESCSYTQKDIMLVSSDAIDQELQMLNSTIITNQNNMSLLSRGTLDLVNQLQDNVTAQASSITSQAIKELKMINDSYLENQAILKKALSFICEYEIIKI